MPYQSVNPTTGELIKKFANHTDDEIQSALTVAHSLYKSDWSKGPVQPRAAVLNRLAHLIEERAEDLALILVQEMGKRISEARFEVSLTADIARYYAQNAATFLAPAKIQTPKGDAWLEYHAIGVIVAVEPWNFPYYQLVRVAAPNIAVGNPVQLFSPDRHDEIWAVQRELDFPEYVFGLDRDTPDLMVQLTERYGRRLASHASDRPLPD